MANLVEQPERRTLLVGRDSRLLIQPEERVIPDSCEHVYKALLEKGMDTDEAAAITWSMHNKGSC